MSTSIFEQVTSLFTVMSICGPLGPDIPEGTPLSEIENLLDPGDDLTQDPFRDPSRVMHSDGYLVGILEFSDYATWEEEEDRNIFFVENVMRLPEPSQFLSASTTVLEAIHLFASMPNKTFYVMHGNQVVGYLEYSHLFHPVGRLALLSIALEIEDQALRLCQHPPFREDVWQSIPDNRRNKAVAVFRQRYAHEPEQPKDIDRLIDCTQLVDKATMIWKRKLISSSRSKLLSFFQELKNIRDFCAHPQRASSHDELMQVGRLSMFISEADSMRKALNDALLDNKVSREHWKPFLC